LPRVEFIVMDLDRKVLYSNAKQNYATSWNFNVEAPIVSENGVYKFSGCKKHNCPSFQTIIYYDARQIT